jgi:hypothetical protein
MHELTQQSRDLLTGAGWFPGRSTVVLEAEDWIRNRGFPPDAPGLNLVRELEDLQVAFPNPHVPPATQTCTFAIGLIQGTDAHLDQIGATLGETVISFGLFDDGFLLVLTASGRVFGALERAIFDLGEDVCDAINRLSAARPPERREMLVERPRRT